MNTGSEFALAWEDYRRRVRWFFGVWLGGFALVASLATLLDKLSFGTVALWVLGPAWVISFAVFGVRAQLFKCPRCHRQFFNAEWYYNSLARKCVHCGLPKWSGVEKGSSNL